MSAGASERAVRGEPIPVAVRDYDDAIDEEALRACVIELQEWERGFEPAMPAGLAMVDAYIALQKARCAVWQGKILVADLCGEVVGYACVWGRVPSEEPDDDPSDYAYLADLLVRGAHRRKGVGGSLMRAVESHAHACGMRSLRVRMLARNTSARSFYRKHGFGEAEIEMLKRLAG